MILLLFTATTSVLLVTNFKKLNQRNNESVNFSSFRETTTVRLPKFAFLDTWQTELLSLEKRSLGCDRLVYPDLMLISSLLDQIINHVIMSFVQPWYKALNSAEEDVFLDEIRAAIKYALIAVYQKLACMDFADLVVLRLVPIFTDHFRNCVGAKTLIRRKYATKKLSLSDQRQMDLLVSQFYNHGKLHPSVNSFRENAQFSTLSQKAHLRTKLNKVLPLILDRCESECQPVRLLVREILVNCVLLPVVRMLVDPDFWNQMIVERIGSTLKDRTRVIRLRAELQKYSKSATKSKKLRARPNGTGKKRAKADNKLFETKLSLNTSQAVFERYLKTINRSSSVVDLRSLKFYVSLQLQKTMRSEEYRKVKEEKPEEKKDRKGSEYDKYKVLVKRLQIIQLTITNRMNSLNLENETSSIDSGSQSIQPTADPHKITLPMILNDPSLLTYYMEYMDQSQRMLMLQFWLVVNGIKSPLEAVSSEDLYEDDCQSSVNDAEMDRNLHFANDILSIFDNYFGSKLIIENNKIVYENVETFVKAHRAYKEYLEKPDKDEFELYNRKKELNRLFLKARKAVLLLQAHVFRNMEEDLENFRNSNIYLKLLASENSRLYTVSQNQGEVGLGIRHDEKNGDPLANYNDDDVPRTRLLDDSSDFSVSSIKAGSGGLIFDTNEMVVSYDVVNAVEDALNEIIENNNDYKSYDAVKLKSDILLGVKGDDPAEEKGISKLFGYKDIFGQSLSLFKGDFKDKEKEKEKSEAGEKKESKKFILDDEINEIEDMDLVISEMINSEAIGEYDTAVHLAAPGDLSLTEEIGKLNSDIENLNGQVHILQPLLKKAELTNNVAELRILRKAHVSLQREVQLKELQRQQYIVQENDNSLYGKSRVSILSYITSTDEESGKEYTSYIIEVQKLSKVNGEDTVLAGWIVARRFSQFYMLNRYLRLVYPEAKTLSFPKKNIMVLNTTQLKMLVESRKALLEIYLRELLKLPEVCKSRIFRVFLLSQSFSNDMFKVKNDKVDGPKEKYKAIEDVTAKLYNSITNGIEYLNGSLVFANSNAQNAGLTSLKFAEDKKMSDTDLQTELNLYDEDKTTFVKPICDLFLSLFALDRSNSWLRGRAILVVLQQLLGSTIERKIRDYVSVFKTETKVIDLLNMAKDKLWPNDVFFLAARKDQEQKRTEEQKKNTREESRTLLEIIITDISSKIVGLNNAKFAASELHGMLQNEILNTHLVYSLIDEVLEAIFPEIGGEGEHPGEEGH